MKEKLLKIKITKGILIIPEDQLLHSLPASVLVESLQRGKAFKRYESMKKRAKR